VWTFKKVEPGLSGIAEVGWHNPDRRFASCRPDRWGLSWPAAGDKEKDFTTGLACIIEG
jgi:hypothetical protein